MSEVRRCTQFQLISLSVIEKVGKFNNSAVDELPETRSRPKVYEL